MFVVPPGANVVPPEPPDLVGGQYRGHHNVPTWLTICNMRVSPSNRLTLRPSPTSPWRVWGTPSPPRSWLGRSNQNWRILSWLESCCYFRWAFMTWSCKQDPAPIMQHEEAVTSTTGLSFKLIIKIFFTWFLISSSQVTLGSMAPN